MFITQGCESNCERIKKKIKKNKKLVNGTAEDGVPGGHSEMTNGTPSGKRIHKTKDTSNNVGNSVNSSPETVGKKKKSVINGHKIKSKKFSEAKHAVEQETNKDHSVHKIDDTNESCSQQSERNSRLNSSLSCNVDKKRKRKKKEEKNLDLNSPDSAQDVDESRSKKLKTNTDGESQSEKMVVSSSDVQPGAFENYRISPSMVDKLRCM